MVNVIYVLAKEIFFGRRPCSAVHFSSLLAYLTMKIFSQCLFFFFLHLECLQIVGLVGFGIELSGIFCTDAPCCAPSKERVSSSQKLKFCSFHLYFTFGIFYISIVFNLKIITLFRVYRLVRSNISKIASFQTIEIWSTSFYHHKHLVFFSAKQKWENPTKLVWYITESHFKFC